MEILMGMQMSPPNWHSCGDAAVLAELVSLWVCCCPQQVNILMEIPPSPLSWHLYEEITNPTKPASSQRSLFPPSWHHCRDTAVPANPPSSHGCHCPLQASIFTWMPPCPLIQHPCRDAALPTDLASSWRCHHPHQTSIMMKMPTLVSHPRLFLHSWWLAVW